ncbi:hypothetical protein CF326_g7442 [Tilletia indica]|nr:hypothetical protein CF326_g7442 [Tilletia indica]
MGMDIQDAFYNISPHPSQRPHLCVRLGPDRNYVRASSPFGHKGICAIFGRTVDCTCDIVAQRFPGLKFGSWVDDIGAIRTDGPASGITEEQVRAEFARLGWPLHPPERKGFNFSRRFVLTGIEWDLDAVTMTLPEDKRRKYLSKAQAVLLASSRRVGRAEMDSLVGSLLRVCLFAPGRRCQLSKIMAFRRSLWAPFIFHHTTTALCSELWVTFLENGPISRSFRPPSRISTTLYASDACDAGLGIVCGLFAAFWSLPPGWKDLEGLDMGVAEAWAMEALVLAAIELGERDCVLSILGDNKGVIFGWLKGRSASEQVNETFVRMVASAATAGIKISPSYINTHHNPADRVSRGDTSGFLPFPVSLQNPWPLAAGILPSQ